MQLFKTNSAKAEQPFDLNAVEADIELALRASSPLQEKAPIEFAPPAVRNPPLPLPEYVKHRDDVDELGRVAAEAVVVQFESAVRSLEAMGTTLVDCVKRADKMAAECKQALAYVQETADQYRDEAKKIFDRIEAASALTAEVRDVCDEMRRKIEQPSPSS